MEKNERRTTVQWLSIHVNHENDMVVRCQTLKKPFYGYLREIKFDTCSEHVSAEEDEHPGTQKIM